VRDSRFPQKLALYNQCRASGWAPRGGIAHGVEFLLYRPGEKHDHAPYAVVLVRSAKEPLPISVMQVARNIVNVAKQLLVCSVSGGSVEEWNKAAFRSLHVDMILLGRWDPDADRNTPVIVDR